eukprot:COSAG02_NODE_385_length_23394_cov_43.838807_13_plen_64_part_00
MDLSHLGNSSVFYPHFHSHATLRLTVLENRAQSWRDGGAALWRSILHSSVTSPDHLLIEECWE